VKEVLREYGRTVGIFAAAGLVLSLLVGFLARNPFGVIVLRALLFAIAFGAVGALLQYVARRFLPELFGGGERAGRDGGPADDAAAARPEGSTIDIVLPEEPLPVPEGKDEILEELPGTGDAAGTAAVEELEAAEPAAASGDGTAPNAGSPRARDGLDALPDIAPLGRTAEDAREGRRGASRFADERARPLDGLAGAASTRARATDVTRDVLEHEDPASLARAVRTVLKREERS